MKNVIPFLLICMSLVCCTSKQDESVLLFNKISFKLTDGEEGTQYFIRPILFKDEKSNEDLILDITFRYRNEIKDSAIVNFSIKSSIIYKTIDSIKLLSKDNKIESDQIVLLFNEKSKTGFTSRYSTRFSLNEIKEMFNNNAWEMIIYNENKITSYKPHRKTIRAINAVRDRVFVLM